MTETLRNVLEGKSTLIKNNQYLSAASYVNPFLERLDILHPDIECLVRMPEQVSLTDNNPDIIYNKVLIKATLPDSYYQHDVYRKAIFLAYGLDCKIPVAKLYIGDVNTSNGNFIAFNQTALNLQNLEPLSPINYSCVQPLLEAADNNRLMIENIKQVNIDRGYMTRLLGEWLDFTFDAAYINDGGKVKLATSCPIDAYKSLLKDKDSIFYIPEDHTITLYDIYQALLYQITKDDKDIINRFEKTMLINRMLHL